MTHDEALALPIGAPIKLLDGKYGLFIRDVDNNQEIGVQVPGEMDIRYLCIKTITPSGNGALIERLVELATKGAA